MVKVQITDEDLAPRNNNYFEEGVHEVAIQKAERGTTDGGKDYVEFTVMGLGDEEGTARVWLTTDKAAKYALSIMAGIAVHNQKNEVAKQKVRDAFKAITDTDEIDNKFLKKFEDMQAWYMVQMSDRTYTNNDGETKNSYDRNIYGYEPKMKPMTADKLMEGLKNNGTAVDTDEVPFK